MRRIEITLDPLQIIGGLVHLDDQQPVGRQAEPRKFGKWRLEVVRPHIGPYQPASLAHGIGCNTELLGERPRRRLGRRLNHAAIARNLPAMIEAAQTARLIAPVSQRGASMRAELIDQAQFTVAGTEQHELFAQQLDPGGCTAGRRDFLGFGSRNPIAAHKLAHRLAFADLSQRLVFLGCQHGNFRPCIADCANCIMRESRINEIQREVFRNGTQIASFQNGRRSTCAGLSGRATCRCLVTPAAQMTVPLEAERRAVLRGYASLAGKLLPN